LYEQYAWVEKYVKNADKNTLGGEKPKAF